jgi:type 1 glutamine amidotransferase
MPNETAHILLVTGGHPFEREPLFTLFDGLEGVDWTHVGQPAAQALFSVEHASRFDAFVCYDMPGIRLYPDREPDYEEPDAVYKERFLELLESGHGFVFLHHAITSWPAWEEFAEIVGGRWQYLPGELRGELRQDSGFRQNVTHTVRVLKDHPVTRGVPESFQITDELYLYEVFDDSIEPLLASDYEYTQENFYSAAVAVREQRIGNEGWERPPGSNLVGWTKTYGKSRIVYLQCGHDSVAFACPEFQLLLKNAIHWVAAP